MNRVILRGNLGKDAEVIISEKSKMVSFSVATSEYLGKDETGKRKENVQWHSVLYFCSNKDSAQKIASFLKKGTSVLVEGKLSYVNKMKDNITYQKTYIVAQRFELLSSKPLPPKEEKEEFEQLQESQVSEAIPTPSVISTQMEDDLPF